MIGRLRGTLVAKNPPQLLVDVNGLGYEVDVPMSTLFDLPETGSPVTLLTHLVVREDAQLLYGFLTAPEREAFRLLIRISGIGPRIALAVLSGMSTEELAQAVARQESGRLQKVPGIGKKTAERLLLELKGKLAEAIGGETGGAPADAGADVINALMALGYNEREALAAAKAVPAGTPVSEAIRAALKGLSKV